MPAGSALVSLRVDSAEGTLVVIADHAAGVVPSLEREAGLVHPAIVGPVMRETVNGVELERAAIQFRLPNPTPDRR